MSTERKWLSLEDVAEVLGVSTWTVRRWITEGHLRAVKLGSGGKSSHIRVSTSALDEFLESCEIGAGA